MILPTSARQARSLSSEFVGGTVRKVYVARVRGQFPMYEPDILGQLFANNPIQRENHLRGATADC
jgi:23S rRNA-/tRNA-specific pseudouridylate synthase